MSTSGGETKEKAKQFEQIAFKLPSKGKNHFLNEPMMTGGKGHQKEEIEESDISAGDETCSGIERQLKRKMTREISYASVSTIEKRVKKNVEPI